MSTYGSKIAISILPKYCSQNECFKGDINPNYPDLGLNYATICTNAALQTKESFASQYCNHSTRGIHCLEPEIKGKIKFHQCYSEGVAKLTCLSRNEGKNLFQKNNIIHKENQRWNFNTLLNISDGDTTIHCYNNKTYQLNDLCKLGHMSSQPCRLASGVEFEFNQ